MNKFEVIIIGSKDVGKTSVFKYLTNQTNEDESKT